MKTIAITIDDEMLVRLERLSRRAGSTTVNRSKAIREAIEAHVHRLERDAENAREAAVVRRHRQRLKREARALVRQQAKP